MNALALNETRDAKFLYLNRENRWLGFKRYGLELEERTGALTLATVPRLQDAMPEDLLNARNTQGIAGIAVASGGNVYFSDPAAHRIFVIDGCDGTARPVPCIGGQGVHPTQFQTPRGLAIHAARQALFVADSGNNRIQAFDLRSFQLTGVWEGLADPRSLAIDSAGNLYVAEYGNHRVSKFDWTGAFVAEFSDRIQSQQKLHRPIEIAVDPFNQTTDVFVLDQASSEVFLFDQQGNYSGQAIELNIANPMGLAAKGDALYVGDADRNRILKFRRVEPGKWVLVGEAVAYQAPVAALAVTKGADLWAHAGGGNVPLRLQEKTGYVRQGFLWDGPFVNPGQRREQLHRVRAMMSAMPPGAHFRLFVYSTDGSDRPSETDISVAPWDGIAQEWSPKARTSNHPGNWQRVPLNVTEFVFPGVPGDRVWIGAEFTSEDGLGSLALDQIRLDFDHEKHLQYLPAIYRENPQSAQLLGRFLALFGSVFGELELEIGQLSHLFDADAVPAQFLSWLAGWLALEVAEEWSEERKRAAIAQAFELYAKRGTAEGLKGALQFFAGLDAHIEEPILQSNWWALCADEASPPEHRQTSILGFTTMLVPAEAQGAVVGTTAVLDQSHLITQEEFGTPIFDDVAHQFAVRLYRGAALSPQTIETVLAVLDREKPAHTDYHLCLVEPNLRVGFQSRIGIDTVIAGPSRPFSLSSGDAPRTDFVQADFVLGGEGAGSIGQTSQVGKTTRLGLRAFGADHP